MAVRLCEELHATGLVELLQFLKHLWSVHLELFDACSGERECHLEVLAVVANHIMQHIECGHVRTLGDVADATLILVVIVIIMVGTDIEETVTFEMNDLMYLKI